jgi:hypothetical protein
MSLRERAIAEYHQLLAADGFGGGVKAPVA